MPQSKESACKQQGAPSCEGAPCRQRSAMGWGDGEPPCKLARHLSGEICRSAYGHGQTVTWLKKRCTRCASATATSTATATARLSTLRLRKRLMASLTSRHRALDSDSGLGIDLKSKPAGPFKQPDDLGCDPDRDARLDEKHIAHRPDPLDIFDPAALDV